MDSKFTKNLKGPQPGRSGTGSLTVTPSLSSTDAMDSDSGGDEKSRPDSPDPGLAIGSSRLISASTMTTRSLSRVKTVKSISPGDQLPTTKSSRTLVLRPVVKPSSVARSRTAPSSSSARGQPVASTSKGVARTSLKPKVKSSGTKLKKKKSGTGSGKKSGGKKKGKGLKGKKKSSTILETEFINPFAIFPMLSQDALFPSLNLSNEILASYLRSSYSAIGGTLMNLDPSPAYPATLAKEPAAQYPVFYKYPTTLMRNPDGTVRPYLVSELIPCELTEDERLELQIEPNATNDDDTKFRAAVDAARRNLIAEKLRRLENSGATFPWNVEQRPVRPATAGPKSQ